MASATVGKGGLGHLFDNYKILWYNNFRKMKGKIVMKRIGMYKDKEVWGCSRAEYEDIYDSLDNEIYYLVNNNQLVYRNCLIGLVDRNWHVTDVTPKVFYKPPIETCCETCHERSEVTNVTDLASTLSERSDVTKVLASAFEPLAMESVELGVYNEEVEK